jgi:hypothetical protein
METKSISTFLFSLLTVTLAYPLGLYVAAMVQGSAALASAINPMFCLAPLLLIVLGSIMRFNWLGATQVLLAILVIVTVTASTNIIVGLVVGMAVFGYFTFSSRPTSSISGDTASVLGTGLKWILGTVGGWVVGFVLDKLFD